MSGGVAQVVSDWGPWVVNGGAVALLFYVARLYYTGQMISASQQKSINELQDKRFTEMWKINHDLNDANRKLMETNQLQAQQISRLVELGRLSEALLRALNYSLEDANDQRQDRGPVS